MFATTTPKSAPVVWQGKTQDGYTLRLTRSGLAKIVSNLKQTGLHTLVQNNLNGNREAAVIRAIAQVVSNATRSRSGQNTQVFTAVGKTRKYQIVTQPIDRQQSAILFVRSLPLDLENEFEGEFEYESESQLWNESEGMDAPRRRSRSPQRSSSARGQSRLPVLRRRPGSWDLRSQARASVPQQSHSLQQGASTAPRRRQSRSPAQRPTPPAPPLPNNIINSHRTNQNVGRRRNIAFAIVNAGNMRGERIERASGNAIRPRFFNATQAGTYLRDNDSEIKILDEIASRLVSSGNTQSRGSVFLYTQRPPCPSCSNVFRQFRHRFPNIDLKVQHGGRRQQTLRRRSSTRTLKSPPHPSKLQRRRSI